MIFSCQVCPVLLVDNIISPNDKSRISKTMRTWCLSLCHLKRSVSVQFSHEESFWCFSTSSPLPFYINVRPFRNPVKVKSLSTRSALQIRFSLSRIFRAFIHVCTHAVLHFLICANFPSKVVLWRELKMQRDGDRFFALGIPTRAFVITK